MAMPGTNRGGGAQRKGKSHGNGEMKFASEMLNLRCLEDNSVKINAQQVDGNSELMLRRVLRVTISDLFSLVILRITF